MNFNEGELKLHKVSTENNPSDLVTKHLEPAKIMFIAKQLVYTPTLAAEELRTYQHDINKSTQHSIKRQIHIRTKSNYTTTTYENDPNGDYNNDGQEAANDQLFDNDKANLTRLENHKQQERLQATSGQEGQRQPKAPPPGVRQHRPPTPPQPRQERERQMMEQERQASEERERHQVQGQAAPAEEQRPAEQAQQEEASEQEDGQQALPVQPPMSSPETASSESSNAIAEWDNYLNAQHLRKRDWLQTDRHALYMGTAYRRDKEELEYIWLYNVYMHDHDDAASIKRLDEII
eukprot:3264733-Amphidinium_carterae.6